MRVYIRFLCVDLPLQSAFQEIEVDEGATVEQAVIAYSMQNRIEDSLQKLPETLFMIGDKAAQHGTVLRDDDELKVLRLMAGG